MTSVANKKDSCQRLDPLLLFARYQMDRFSAVIRRNRPEDRRCLPRCEFCDNAADFDPPQLAFIWESRRSAEIYVAELLHVLIKNSRRL
uniref:Uncharacterized protein n=1 Tax=Ditylenchus dipsaci TaxID=166011 RepID=A0A915DSI4_9BILA